MATVGVTACSTPNISRSSDTLSNDFTQSECRRCHWMIHRSSLMRSRSRRPLSVDDVRVAEVFLVDDSLDKVSESFSEDSGVFSPSPCSSSSSFSCSEGTGKSTFNITSTSFSTPMPNPQRRLFSCPEDTRLVAPSLPSMEALFSEINEDVGASWRKLGQHVLKREYMLNNIDADFNGVGEKAHQLLLKWKEESGGMATPQALFLAMIQIKRTDIAKKLIMLVPSLMPLSHLLGSVITSDCTLYSSCKLKPENLEVEKELRSKDEKVLVCSNTETSERFVLKQVKGEKNAFAVRKCTDCKVLRQQRQHLRKTEEFVKDLEMKQKMVQDLLDVIKQLQNHLHTQHQAISEQQFSCHNCGQYTIKQYLVEKELMLLHHELQRMIASKRRISVSGIPAERIYNLATRTYSVCEEHREMHSLHNRRRSMCQQHSEDAADSDDSDDPIDGPLMCTLNVILGIGRRRKVTQSLKSKKSSANNKMKLAKSNSNPLSSNANPLLNRQSYFLAQENPVVLPNLHTPDCRDWSGVPAFKLCSDFKMPSSSGNSSNCTYRYQQDRHSKVPQNPASITPGLFQLSSDLKIPSSSGNSSSCAYQQDRCSKVPKNPTAPVVDENENLIPLQWLKGLEPDDELII